MIILIIMVVVMVYFTGLTASVYYWVRTDQWMRSSYSEDEDIICALLWFIYWPICWFLLLVSVPFSLAEELGKQHRGEKK